MRKIIALLASLLLLVGCGQQAEFGPIEYTNSVDIETKAADMTLYANMPLTGHPFEKVSSFELVANLIAGGGTGAIFFGNPSCAWCNLAVPVLSDAANEMNVKIYYVNPKEAKGESELFTDLAKDFLDEDATLFMPNLFIVKNGEILVNYLGIPASYSGGSMTEDQTSELRDEYQTMLNKLQD